MKKTYPSIRLTCVAFLLMAHFAAVAQLPVSVSGTLDGEAISQGEYFDWGGQIVGTGSALYSKSITKGSSVTAVDTTFDRIWTAPPPRKIRQIYIKIQNYTDSTGKVFYSKQSENDLIVLLDNGDVYKLYVDHYENNKGGVDVANQSYWDHAASHASESYQKIIGDRLYILSSAYLYTTKDSTNWQVDSTGLNGAHIYGVALDTTQKVYAATSTGIFLQDTTPASKFTSVTAYGGPKNVYNVFVDRANRMLASPNSGGIYYSQNGSSWVLDTAGIGNQFVRLFGDDAYGNLYAIATNTATGADKLYKSTNGTQKWQQIDSSIYTKTNRPISISSFIGDSLLFITTQYGSFTSLDGGATWLLSNKGIKAEYIGGVAKTAQGRLLLADNLGIYAKQGGATTWTKVYPQQGFVNNLQLYDDGLGDIYTIDNSLANNLALGFLQKSTDGGNTWVADTLGLSQVGGSVFFVDEKGTQHIGNSSYSFSRPSEMWQKPKNGVWAIDTTGFPVAPYSFVYGITSDHAGYLYATGYFNGKKLMRRSITGTQWVVDTAGIPSTISYFDKITGNKGDVIGITGTGIYHRGTGTWHKVPLPTQVSFPLVSAAAIDTSGYIFVALNALAGAGVYFTNDLGTTWKYAGLDSAGVSSIVCYGDTAYVLTRNMGAFALNHQSVLPVTLSALTAYQLGKGIQVGWSGYDEINMAGYDVERSANGSQFTKIGNAIAKGGGVLENKYSFFDGVPHAGDNFYRIKAISKNGTYQYSGIVKVNIENTLTGLFVYPNPVQNKTINVQLANIVAGRYTLAVYSAAGQKLYARELTHQGGSAAIAINAPNMAKGVYWVVLKGRTTTYKKTLLVQ